MAEVKVPRFMISAPGSGSGKTTIVCGLLKALMEKGPGNRSIISSAEVK